MRKLLSASVAAASFVSMGVSAPAVADISATGGFLSDYYFRGARLGEASAYGSIDYEQSGFTLGAWAVDDSSGANDGLEVDYYASYGMQHDDFLWSVGFTSYQYTYSSDFENEINLGLAVGNDNWGGVSVDIAVGNDEDPDNGSGAGVDIKQSYVYAALSYSKDVFNVSYASKMAGDQEVDGTDVDDTDYSYSYLEASAATEVSGLNVGLTLGKQIDNNSAGNELDNSDYYMVFDISKSFSL